MKKLDKREIHSLRILVHKDESTRPPLVLQRIQTLLYTSQRNAV